MRNETDNRYLAPRSGSDGYEAGTRWRILLSVVFAAFGVFVFVFSAFSLWLGLVVANQKYLNWWPTNSKITNVRIGAIRVSDEYIVVVELGIALVGFIITTLALKLSRKLTRQRQSSN